MAVIMCVCTFGGLDFHFGIGVRPKGPNKGATGNELLLYLTLTNFKTYEYNMSLWNGTFLQFLGFEMQMF